MSWKDYLLALSLPFTAFCGQGIEEKEALAARTSDKEEVSQLSQNVILEELRGILLLGDWNLVRKEPIDEIEGVEAKEVDLLSRKKNFLVDLQYQFVGKPLTQTTIQEIKGRIADFYESENQPLVVVSTPKQEVTKGVLQLVVNEAKLGEIRCKGNNYFTSNLLRSYIQAKPGKPIVADELVKDLAFMNHSPFRRTDAVFTPGAKPGIADLELITIDRWPYRFYVGADNSGTISTERNRLFLGVNLGKTIVKDSEVSYQYTTAPNGNRFYSHTASVRVPIPWFGLRHTAQAFGGYASVNPSMNGSGIKSSGESWYVDLRYRIPIYDDMDLLQELVFGYDFKESNTRTKGPGGLDHYGLADIDQFSIGYNLGMRNRLRKISLNIELFGSPAHFTNHNNTKSFQTLRDQANAQYAYLKFVHSLLQEISSGWRFSYNLSGQVSSTNLLPSEQFTMTGYNGVRGFEERVLNLDNAALLNLTIETPHCSPAYWMGWCKHYDDLYIAVFFDSAIGGNHETGVGEPKFQSLGSIGPTVRYELSQYCAAHLDYGFQLWHTGFNPETDSRYNFGLVLSY